MYWTIHCWKFYILYIIKANIAVDKVKQRRKTLFKSVSIKDRSQNSVYLNSIEMGDGIYGAEAVAQQHFGTTAAKLTEDQSALIAASLPNPRKFDSGHPSSYMKRRQHKIRHEMRNVRVWMRHFF